MPHLGQGQDDARGFHHDGAEKDSLLSGKFILPNSVIEPKSNRNTWFSRSSFQHQETRRDDAAMVVAAVNYRSE